MDEGGNMTAAGSKSAAVETATHGRRLLFATESPEVWLEDFGTAHLVDGEALVEVEPVFAETANLERPYRVFAMPVGPEPFVISVAERRARAFRLVGRTLDGRPVTGDVDYRIVARRLGYEDVRLPEPAR